MSRLREIIRDRRVAGALAVVALLLVGYRLLPFRGTEAPVERAASEAAREGPEGIPAGGPKPSAGMQESSDSLRIADRSAPKVIWSWRRNPFLPWGSSVSADAGSKSAVGRPHASGGTGTLSDLRGTVVAGRIGMAIFGNRLVPVGGTIGEWTVEQVEPYRVAMRKGSETRVLEMFKPAPSSADGRGGDQ